jgi:murein DD-endopeptidase MepM/ murein hydrolase activator NlpD
MGDPAAYSMSNRPMFAARNLLLWAALACVLAAGPVFAQDEPPTLRLTPDRVKQGGITAVRVGGAVPAGRARLRVGSRQIPLTSSNTDGTRLVWIGVDLEQPPGPLEVVLEAAMHDGRPVRARAALVVLDAAYPVQRLTVPRSFTELDAPTLERIAREKAVLDRLWETATPERFWRSPFRSPLEESARGAGFGLKRIINGDPRAPHTGVDFSVPAGTPVFASNAGLVALAEEHFFGGRSLVLDHGEGLYTMYFHLQESLVQPGQRVTQGELIGRVGSTGRATGPHLHWGVRLYGARINPDDLLRLRAE